MPVRLVFWILLCVGVLTALSTWTPFPDLHWFSSIFLGIGLFIFFERPLMRAGYPAPFESSVAALFALVFLAHLGYALIVPRFEAEEVNSKPCAPQNIETRCYTFSRENCSTVWGHFEQECRDEVKRTVTSRRSTMLTGPLVRKCTFKKLDQAFHSNRRTPVDSTCQAHFNTLDAQTE